MKLINLKRIGFFFRVSVLDIYWLHMDIGVFSGIWYELYENWENIMLWQYYCI